MVFRFGKNYKSQPRRIADLIRALNDDNEIKSGSISDSGTATGTFGSGSEIPVITVDSKGFITSISNTDVAGVTGVTFTAANNNLRISTADGAIYDAQIDVSDKATWSALTSTNTAIRTLLNGNLANTNAYIATRSSEADSLSRLANTNAYIASVSDTERSALANTNAYIASVSDTERSALANTNAYIATRASEADSLSRLANTNAYIATRASEADSLSRLANTNAYIATRASEADSLSRLANTNAYIASVSDTERSALANTNAYIASVSDTERSALANTNAYIASVSDTERSALANTNAYIASVSDTERSALANTNAYIASVSDTERSALANTNAYIATRASEADSLSRLANTNAYIATRASEADSLSRLANTNAYIATRASEADSLSRLANTNAYIATRASEADSLSRLANTNAYIATRASEADSLSRLANTNAYIATRASEADSLSRLANTNAYIATRASEADSLSRLANTNAYIATRASEADSLSRLANTNAYIASVSSDLWSALTSTNTSIRSAISTEVSNLVDSAPATLDTLNELAAALGDDADFSTTITTNLSQKLGSSASITLSGDVSGSGSFSSNAVSITTTIADDSHNHVISNVDGLQSVIDGKVSTNSSQALSSATNAMTISGHTITLNRGDGTTDTVTVPDNNTNTTYDLLVPSGTTKIRLDPSDSSGNDDIEIFGGTNVTVTRNSDNKLTISSTDTDTWRGIRDNLTSTDTDKSLSANQGKVLKGLVDGKLGSSSKAADSEKLDGLNSTKFTRETETANATAGPGWITVAKNNGSRHRGEVIISDAESSDHSYIRIEWMHSYADSVFTVLNCGGHSNRIRGVRVLSQDSDNTYGWKYLQVNVSVSSNYRVQVIQPASASGWSGHTAVAPVLQNTVTGYSLHGNQLEDLHDYSLSSEEGSLAGGNIRTNGAYYVDSTKVIDTDAKIDSGRIKNVPSSWTTWRGIQDNLTSTSTTESLSANQGKVLKGLVDGKASSSHSHSISSITDEHRLFNNMGDNHSTATNFNSISQFGARFVQGSTNGPGTGSSQFYGFTLGLGNEYPFSSYGLQFAIPRYTSNDNYLSFRSKESGTWGSWVKAGAGNADKWTTARTNTVTLTGDVTGSGSASVDGTGNWNVSVASTVANDSHSHSNYLSKTGDTMTGRLVLPDGGYSIGNEYHTWKRSYSVNNTSPKELLYHNGNSLPLGGVYRFHAHISGTGTDQSATAVYWNQNGTWKVNVTYQSGTSSNHPEFIIGGSPEKPQIHIDHPSNYAVEILGERIELSEGTGTDNLAGFGTDAFLGSVGGALRYNNAGGANNYNQGNIVFHDSYHPNADKWTTARTLSLTDDVTGSVSWDGSGNASLSTTVADDSHNHTSLTGVTSIGFNAQSTDSASISTAISGTHTYFDFNLTDDNDNDWWRWRFTPSGSTVYDAMVLKPVSNGKANLTISGDLTVSDGDITINNNNGGINFNDTSKYWLKTATNWGIYWDTTNNQLEFHGAGNARFNFDLDDGIAYHAWSDLSSGVKIGNEVVLQESSDRADLLQITSSTSTWGGLQIRNSSDEGRWSFMTDGETAGIYNDEDGIWQLYMHEDGRNAFGSSTITSGYRLDVHGHMHMHNSEINYVHQIHFNDNVRFYDNGDDSILNFKAGDTTTGSIRFYNGSGTRSGRVYFDGSGSQFGLLNKDDQWAIRTTATNTDLYYDGNNKLQTLSNGVNVTGTLFATDKSFLIDHPTKEGYKLRHGVVERPENSVYVRGQLKGTNVIDLPDYWTGLVYEDSITVQLTSNGSFQKLFIKEIKDNKVIIGNKSWFSNKTDCFYYVQATRKDIEQFEVEYENK